MFRVQVFRAQKALGPELKNTFVQSRARTGDPRTPLVEGPGTQDPSLLGRAREGEGWRGWGGGGGGQLIPKYPATHPGPLPVVSGPQPHEVASPGHQPTRSTRPPASLHTRAAALSYAKPRLPSTHQTAHADWW